MPIRPRPRGEGKALPHTLSLSLSLLQAQTLLGADADGGQPALGFRARARHWAQPVPAGLPLAVCEAQVVHCPRAAAACALRPPPAAARPARAAPTPPPALQADPPPLLVAGGLGEISQRVAVLQRAGVLPGAAVSPGQQPRGGWWQPALAPAVPASTCPLSPVPAAAPSCSTTSACRCWSTSSSRLLAPCGATRERGARRAPGGLGGLPAPFSCDCPPPGGPPIPATCSNLPKLDLKAYPNLWGAPCCAAPPLPACPVPTRPAQAGPRVALPPARSSALPPACSSLAPLGAALQGWATLPSRCCWPSASGRRMSGGGWRARRLRCAKGMVPAAAMLPSPPQRSTAAAASHRCPAVRAPQIVTSQVAVLAGQFAKYARDRRLVVSGGLGSAARREGPPARAKEPQQ